MLVILTILSKQVEIFLPRSAIFDLSLFTLVVLQHAYGLPTGLVVTTISYLIGTLIKGKFTGHVAGETLVLPPIGFLITSLVISTFSFDIFTTGLIATGIYAGMMTIAFGILYGFPILDILIYLATIIPFNYFMFSTFGPQILRLLTG